MRITPWLHMVGSRQFGLSCAYDCHIYALRSIAGILLIDAGSGLATERVLENLEREFEGDIEHGTILVTHKHPDHAAGAAALSQALGWPVWTSVYTVNALAGGDAVASGLVGAQASGGYPTSMTFPPCPVAGTFDDGDTITLEGFVIRAIRVRGHSDDAMAFYFEHAGLRCLLPVDIVFYGGAIGLINSHDSNLADFRSDLPKLADLDIDALLPAHGVFTLEGGQQHIDAALAEIRKGFVPRCIGQGDLIF